MGVSESVLFSYCSPKPGILEAPVKRAVPCSETPASPMELASTAPRKAPSHRSLEDRLKAHRAFMAFAGSYVL